MKKIIYFEAVVEPRYWEDAIVNGVRDDNGSRIPFRNGDLWVFTIRLKDGIVLDWPKGTEAKIYYKICDQGEYWLRDEHGRVLKWSDYYVPDDYLCQNGAEGFGDYIILQIDGEGKVLGWKEPKFNPKWWLGL